MTADVAGELYTDQPLADAQASQLTAILTKNRVYTQPNGWTAAISAAAKVLSPNQVAALKTYAASKTGVDYTAGSSP